MNTPISSVTISTAALASDSIVIYTGAVNNQVQRRISLTNFQASLAIDWSKINNVPVPLGVIVANTGTLNISGVLVAGFTTASDSLPGDGTFSFGGGVVNGDPSGINLPATNMGGTVSMNGQALAPDAIATIQAFGDGVIIVNGTGFRVNVPCVFSSVETSFLQNDPILVSQLSTVAGVIQAVSNALSPAVGSAVVGGGSAKALVWFNGTQSTVIGI